ncbi:MAG: M14 family metallopeptidase, partial [Gemmatimonadota bacterium]|nr:M14 family metallopeptidase [Gemmatimonadota bacterium]
MPSTSRTARRLGATILALSLPLAYAGAQKITSPKEQFGYDIGADYQLVNYTQLQEYWQKLAKESNRVKLERVGTSEEGRPMWTVVISSPENIAKLDHYRDISSKLAHAEGLTDDQAHDLAKEGKAVVWIDGGLHATEVLGAQQLIETAYQLISRTDPETMRFLNDDIVLCTLVNPDGMELVSNWYMRNTDQTKRTMSALPRLYQKYIGHDDNRDFYIANQSETQAVNNVLYREWYPQIVYNHHQTGPAGAVMFAPPFRDPFNYNFDPLVPMELDLVGAAMHSRFEAEGKPGVTMRSGSSYSTWWNGGLRTMVYFHNQIGLLTETIGNPTPQEIPFVPQNILPRGDLPFPITPQTWHFRQSIEYSITANRAVLDIASRYREPLLYNFYQMGRNSIARGSRDNWTASPKRIQAVLDQVTKDRAATTAGEGSGRDRTQLALNPFGGTVPVKYFDLLRRPEDRDPRGYILPSNQPDFLTATKFVNALIRAGINIDRATSAFTVAGKNYPAGSYVVRANQAFRPHVLDMFEPQDHPNDLSYPGGPPKPPYDNAGWTLAYQMGVQFDRVLDGFDAPTERIKDVTKAPAGTVARSGGGWLLSHATNDAFIAINRLLKNKDDVYWVKNAFTANGKSYPAGTLYIASHGSTMGTLQALATEKGLSFDAAGGKPAGDAMKLKPTRVALWDQYGGSMPSGHVRWLLEQYEFPFDVVYPQTIDAGNLSAKYDVIVFVGGAIPAADRPERAGGGGAGGDTGERGGGQPKPEDIPAEFRPWLGTMSVAKTIPQIKKFIEDGGTVLTIGSSNNLAYHLGLPVENALTEMVNGQERPLPREKFYVPGSVLSARVDNSFPIAAGVGTNGHVDVFYDNSPAFRLRPDAAMKGVRAVAWFENAHPLRSGWAWGEAYLDQGIEAIDAPFGKGHV